MANKFIYFGFVIITLLAACKELPTWAGGSVEQKPGLPGERVAVLASDSALKADPSLENTPIQLPEPRVNDSWPQHMGNATATLGHLAFAGPSTDPQQVTIAEGEAWTTSLVAAPVVAGGTVFAMDALGHVSAHEAGNISHVLWKSRGVADEEDTPIIGGGLAFDDGTLYITSGLGLVMALDAAGGQEKWRQALNIPMRAAPKVDSGRVYVVTIDSQTYALDAKNGDVLWSHRGINETAGFLSAVSPAAIAMAVVTPYASGEVYALKAQDGGEAWSDSLISSKRGSASAVFTGVGADPVMDGPAVFAVSNGGILAAFHLPSGQRVWEQPIASRNTPWLAGDTLYVLSSDNVVMALRKIDGRIHWVHPLPRYKNEQDLEKPYSWSGPVVAGGHVFIVGAHGQMVMLSAVNGEEEKTFSIPGEVYTAPVIAGGRMYLVTKGATLIAYQ